MEIGEKLRNLRVQKSDTRRIRGTNRFIQRVHLPIRKGFKFTFNGNFLRFLEVLGVTPGRIFSVKKMQTIKVVYREEDSTSYYDEENGYELRWLIPDSNEKEMEPVVLTF